MFNFSECEKALGYTFKDKDLLVRCFTHSSYANEHKKILDNELMEFFGDSILGFIVTEYLFGKKSEDDEGDLTILKQKIVSKKPLSQATLKYGFEKFLLLGEGESRQFSHNKTSLSENLFEAIVAGIYLDGGMEAAKKFIYEHLLNEFSFEKCVDFKSKLQEFVQKEKIGRISYSQLELSGPPHKPNFKMCLMIDEKIISTAEGGSKKQAEQKCAELALEILNKNQGENSK